MSNKKASPGPWNVRQWRGCADYDLAVVDRDGIVIAEVVDLFNDSKNAAMLSAAMDMYEALKYCYAHIRDAAQCGVDISEFYGEMEWRIREALEKARDEG